MIARTFAALILASAACPLAAQEIDLEDTVYAGDYLSVGAGVAVGPSYAGSDDYVLWPAPLLQGSLGGIGINPRTSGIGLDFVKDPAKGAGLDLGIAARMRGDRVSQISDPIVASLGKLERAIEVGPTAGVSIAQVLHAYDSLTLSADVLWDINGAHGGMVVAPSLSYFTPLNRGLAVNLTLGTTYADSDFHDYYYRVTPAQSAATGGALAAYEPRGGGFTNAGATALVGVDLDGDLANGGLALVGIAGYSRMLGNGAETPFTATRGSRSQFLGALGIGYTF